MRNWILLVVWCVGVGLVSAAQGPQTTPPVNDSQPLNELVRQLGSTKFPEREKAHKQLEALGERALAALRQGVKSEDLETSRRAADLLRKLEDKLAAANLLAPKRVHLKLQDVPVLDALAELSKQSGYPILIGGDRTSVAQRKVTLDTGLTTFWEAFDQLCAAAGLVEGATQPNLPGIRLPLQDRAPLRLRVLPVPPVPAVPKAQPPKKPEAAEQVQVHGEVAMVAAVEVPVLAQVDAPPPPVVQIAPLPIQGGIRRETLPGQAGQIVVRVGTPPKILTSYYGAIRVRLQPMNHPPMVSLLPAPPDGTPPALPKMDGIWFLFTISPEPSLRGFSVLGQPHVEKAIDEHGQNLTVAMDDALPNNQINNLRLNRAIYSSTAAAPMQCQLRLKKGEKPSKTLTELKGNLTVQAMSTTQTLVQVDKILQAAGRTVNGANGCSLQIQGMEKQKNGTYRLQLHLDLPPGANAANPLNGAIQAQAGMVQQIQIQINGGVVVGNMNPNHTAGLPELFDAKGQKYQLVNMPSRSLRVVNGAVSQTVTLVFRGYEGLGEPDRLVLTGQRTVTVQVPFAFRDVPLP